MYLGNRKNWQTQEANEGRAQIVKTKSGATWNAFLELEGLVSEKEFAKQYLGKTKKWFNEKLINSGQHNSEAFTSEEYTEIVESLRDVAKRLLAHADEIESAELWTTEFLEKREKEKE